MLPSPSKIKAVFFDIDDTLYMKESDTLPLSVLPALQQLQQAGILVGIATGRIQASFPSKINQLIEQLKIDTLITSNGQYVQCRGKVLRNATLPHKIVRPLVNFLAENHIAYAVLNNQTLCVSELSDKLTHALNPITHHYRIDPNYCDHHDVLQILSFSDESQDALLEHSGLLQGLKTVRWHEHSIDIFEENGSKAKGIQCVSEYLGFTMDNVMAFGDGLNDIEMLCTVGVGIAMGNAHPQLKAHAKYTTKAVNEDGIAHFLQQAGLIT